MRRGLILLLLILTAGCGRVASVAEVSGRVTLGGQPLEGASVTFQPIGNDLGTGSYGRTDADGRYSLKLVQPDQPGAIVGKHRVAISTLGNEQSKLADGGGIELPKDRVPARYNSASELTLDVPPEGTNSADFDLQAP